MSTMSKFNVYRNATSTCNNKTCPTSLASLTAKLRRLKIEESILLQDLNKSAYSGYQSEIEGGSNNHLSFVEFKKFLTTTKNSFTELKKLFEDIKTSTSSIEVLKSVDIDEIKKGTLELESNIKYFKAYLFTEINALKSAEQQLNQKINDPVALTNLKRKPRVQTTKYTEIVLSPVKTIMTSPFKCIQVQEYQNFMQNSKNRYGGWNEYLHNIFISIWQKYFDTDCSTTCLNMDTDSEKFCLFLDELMPKLIGVSQEDVIFHVKWYTKYIYLKYRQQKAINKWRANKRMINTPNGETESEKVGHNKTKCVKKKQCGRRYSINNIDDVRLKEDRSLDKEMERVRTCLSDDMRRKRCTNNSFDVMTKQTPQNFLKSTKQWRIRCSRNEVKSETGINDVENIRKLGIPTWRTGF